MPWGYLISVGILAALTLLALWPLRAPGPLARLSWILTMELDEVPQIGVVWIVAATAIAFADGDVESAGAWLVFALACVTTVGLVVVLARVHRSASTVRRALDRSGMAASRRAHRRPTLAMFAAPVSFLARPGEIERIKNIAYGDEGRAHRLDVYRHRSRPADAPVLVHFHGGGMEHGNKSREAKPLMYRFARQGWVCVSANYRLGGAVRYADRLADVKRVLAWIRTEGVELGADPNLIIVSGSSAGAHLAITAALTPNEPALQPDIECDTSVAAAIGFYGFYGHADDSVPSSPSDVVRAAAPPLLIAHGTNDTFAPVDAARELVERLRAVATQPVVYIELTGAQHSFDLFHSVRYEAVIDGVETFTDWVRAHRSAR
ncbi:MAG TPA: alpha/beta hydrolase [Acidimicrobiia bacterium]|nr:alpha/beta hydrolase [Acidimicrobiia bacterium]